VDVPVCAVSLRDARAGEAGAASAIIREAYEEFRPLFSAEAFAERIERWTEVQACLADCELIFATAGDSIAGTVMFYPDGSRSGQGGWPSGSAGILRLAVRRDHRRSGIAKALTLECIRRCSERRIATLALHTTEWMPVAKAMYERLGFVRDPDCDFAIRNGTALGYRLDVAAFRG